MSYFEVLGGQRLEGEVHVHGAKNAALPMLCGALLTKEECIFHNVPDITDIQTLLDIFAYLGAEVSWSKSDRIVRVKAVSIDPDRLASCELAKQLRASILCIGPLLARFGEVKIPPPGGCIIGARPAFIHVDGLNTLGADIVQDNHEFIHLEYRRESLRNTRLLLSEASVTGTENLALFLALQPETSQVYFSAAEAHVCGVLKMLQQMGVEIDGIGTHHLTITGIKNLKGGNFVIPPDGILVGTYAVATALTQGNVKIFGVDHKELFSFYGILKRIGVQFEMGEGFLQVHPSSRLEAIPKVQTAIFPGFSTDLQSPVGVLLTQCQGESLIFETLFENRLSYLLELEKMGADVEILNAHQAKVRGKTLLLGTEVQSWDLRAGAAMVLAGLVARGKTKITNIQYIDRGYEDFVGNLKRLGARITRVEE